MWRFSFAHAGRTHSSGLFIGHLAQMSINDLEIRVPTTVASTIVEELIETCSTAERLYITLKGTLKKYPGCIHWHLKLTSESKGTLELTYWPSAQRIMFKVNASRSAEWIAVTVPRLHTRIVKVFD